MSASESFSSKAACPDTTTLRTSHWCFKIVAVIDFESWPELSMHYDQEVIHK